MNVLLVEDEETIAVTLRHALEDAGHRVTHAAEAKAALAHLERGDPDVVVTDIRREPSTRLPFFTPAQ